MTKSVPIPFALLGHPVGHSLSPAMHNAAFTALGIRGHYALMDVLPGAIPRTLDDLQRQNYGGVNITIPHKEEAFRFLKARHELSAHARVLQSVNTVVFRPDGTLYGDNTDAPGFLDALREAFRATPRGKRVLLLGCGGAGRALALTCARQGAAAIWVSDINLKARCRLRRDLKIAAPSMTVGGVALSRAEKVARTCDLIIQATPVGMKAGDLPLLPATAFHKGQMILDLIYHPALTPTLAAAQVAGARTANGLGMLLHQGVRAFQLWTGRKPPVAIMRAALEKALKARRS